MVKTQLATPEHMESIMLLWSKLMEIHKEFDYEYFAEAESNKAEYEMNLSWYLKHDSNRVFVAIKDKEVVGYVTAELIFFSNSIYNSISHCSIGDIMVDSNYQYLGIGNALIEEVKNWAKEININTLELNVFSKNVKALGFFKSQGFNNLFHKLELKF